jgi:DDE superfamily endonuclease
MRRDRRRTTSRRRRACKLDTKDVKFLKRAAPHTRIGPLTSRVNKRLEALGRATVSSKTVARALRSGYKPYKPLAPLKTKPVSRVNEAKRVEYCSNQPADYQDSTAFGDSATFSYQQLASGAGHVTYQDPSKRAIQGGGGADSICHMYAIIAKDLKTRMYEVPLKTKPQIASCKGHGVVAFSRETFKSQDFIDVLPDMVADCKQHFGRKHFQVAFDQAKQHSSKATRAFISEHKLPIDLAFPPQSPDLNPIENVWSMVHQQLQNMPLGGRQTSGRSCTRRGTQCP